MREHVALGIALATAIGLSGCAGQMTYTEQTFESRTPAGPRIIHASLTQATTPDGRVLAVLNEDKYGPGKKRLDHVAIGDTSNIFVKDLALAAIGPAIGAGGNILAAHAIRPSNFNIQGGSGGESISGAFAGAVSSAGATVTH